MQDMLLKQVQSKTKGFDEYAKLIIAQKEVVSKQKEAFERMAEFYVDGVQSGTVSEEKADNALSVVTDTLNSLKKTK